MSGGDPLSERGTTPALCSVLGVSRALDGFLSPPPRGLVSSHYHVRDSPFRGLFPPPSRSRLVGAPCPPVVAHRLLVTSCPMTPAPMTSPPGLSSGLRSAATGEAVSLDDARSPPRFLLLRVPLWTPCLRLRTCSALDLDRQTLRVTLATGPQRVDRRPARSSIPR